ncbi:hypothetical protein Pcinc_034268 [Petrolisthes cinctipes]|uniref:PiggyBac transposable element-derived protein domain-containing protein n=1 Tax=Petrolisthes cinctipes TaxID=88211 RepID=A0AAE1EQP7_PETCI|nr:hypothetical protein Pcinc_034268 [Petrolisthes cinctipes]
MASEPQNDCNMDVGETSEEEFSEGSDIDLDSEDSDSTDDTHDVVGDSDNDSIPGHTSPDYQLYKVQSLINHFTRMFKHNFHPGERVSIDESMIGYRGKTPHLRQYMPNKHHSRFGIKVWCVCDAELGYTSHFEVYKGAGDNEDTMGKGTTYNLVMRMLREADIMYRGHHVGMDSFFSSPKLFLDLYNTYQTVATGTVRGNRKGLPKQCIKSKLRDQEVSERRKGHLLCVSYKDKNRQPHLLSTVARAGKTQVTTRRNVVKEKPNVVNIYNKVMVGVDLKDTKLYV